MPRLGRFTLLAVAFAAAAHAGFDEGEQTLSAADVGEQAVRYTVAIDSVR